MVIKTIPWHYAGFGRLTNYLAKERGKEDSIDLEIRHNLRHGGNLSDIVAQFKSNDEFRRQRVRGICLYHEILSFHGEDRASITPEIIEDLTRTYLELRAPNALGFAMVHGDREHLHVHVLLSGNEFGSPKATRLDQARFRSVRRELEAYQIEHYGAELQHSIAHTAKHLKRKERKAQKERVKKEIQRCLDQSDNPRLLHNQLEAAGLKVYTYRGRPNGILYEGRKYRFNQIDIEGLDRLHEVDDRVKELEKIQKAKTDRHQEQERTSEEAHLPDVLEPDTGTAEQAEVEAAQAEAEALRQEAEMEAQRVAEQQMQIEEAQRAAEVEAKEQEASRIQELEAIQDEQRRREQEREL